jgi:hypothetical protein
MGSHKKHKVLVTVKTYPTPASKGAEVSCTAGITDDGKWIRLFPIPFRYMDGDRRFSKYQWIEVEAKKSSDPRKESHEVDIDTLTILSEPLSTRNSWKARKEVVLPVQSPSLCYLQESRKTSGNTLGFFKPKTIQKFIIENDSPDWTEEEKQKLLQYSMFDSHPLKPLEKIPYKFSYRFICNESNCRGHTLMCVDWELGQAYRQWKMMYGKDWEQKIYQRFETDMILRFNTHFFVGTIHGHPHSWIIIGLFYPPK